MSKIALIGDIHGNVGGLHRVMRQCFAEFPFDAMHFIQVGDFGLGFDGHDNDMRSIETIADVLSETDSQMYILRGNHDNPWFWEQYRVLFDRIHFVREYEWRTIGGAVCCFYGGAISIDRTYRTREYRNKGRELYWASEAVEIHPDHDTSLLVNRPPHIDMIVTHDVPHKPFSRYDANSSAVLDWASGDKELLRDIRQHQTSIDGFRATVLDIYQSSGQDYYPTWYHGHYHESYDTPKQESDDTFYHLRGLGIDEIFIHNHTKEV